MLNIFRKKSEHYKRYKKLFASWERYLLTHQNDLIVMSTVATQRAILTLDPVTRAHGIPTIHDPDTLVTLIKPHDLYEMSKACLAEAENYKRDGTERMYQGAILAGVYFGVAGLVAEGERAARGLWRLVKDAMSRSVEVAARSTEYHRPKIQSASATVQSEEEPSLHPKTIDALRKVGMSETRYREISGQRDTELASVDMKLRELFYEQQKLFAEVEKVSENISPTRIYGASMSVMNIFERVMSRSGPPIRKGEPEVVAAGMAKFIDRLYEADEGMLSQIENLSANLCSLPQDQISLLGSKVTRVIVLGRILSTRLNQSAPLCAHEAQWLATTLLSDLDKLTALELGEHFQ